MASLHFNGHFKVLSLTKWIWNSAIKNCIQWLLYFKVEFSAVASVTWFGKIMPLWRNLKSFGNLGFFSIRQSYGNFCFWANFYNSTSPNIEQIINPSGYIRSNKEPFEHLKWQYESLIVWLKYLFYTIKRCFALLEAVTIQASCQLIFSTAGSR